MESKNKFPIKSCIITSIVIFLTYLLCLGILAAAKYANDDFNLKIGRILLIVFSSVFGLLLLFYWIRAIVQYSKKENGK